MNTNIPVAHISKEDVAEVLLRVATILDLAGDNPYRALAYRRAARLVLNAQKPLPELLTPRGRLDLPGLGTNLRLKLGELVITGRLRFGIEVMARLPECADELMVIPTIGPNSARRLHDELGVETLDDAIAAARSHRIRTMHGFGPRKEEQILRGALQAKGELPQIITLPLLQPVDLDAAA